MVAIILALALGVMEYASAIELYKQFIYEETCQAAQMAMFTYNQLQSKGRASGIGNAAQKHGVGPGRKDLGEYGWLIPFAVEALQCFYWAMDFTIMIF